VLLKIPRPGNDDLCCQTIDTNGISQSMQHLFQKSGHNVIQKVQLFIEQWNGTAVEYD
jgi:hypothetical protein